MNYGLVYIILVFKYQAEEYHTHIQKRRFHNIKKYSTSDELANVKTILKVFFFGGGVGGGGVNVENKS